MHKVISLIQVLDSFEPEYIHIPENDAGLLFIPILDDSDRVEVFEKIKEQLQIGLDKPFLKPIKLSLKDTGVYVSIEDEEIISFF